MKQIWIIEADEPHAGSDSTTEVLGLVSQEPTMDDLLAWATPCAEEHGVEARAEDECAVVYDSSVSPYANVYRVRSHGPYVLDEEDV